MLQSPTIIHNPALRNAKTDAMAMFGLQKSVVSLVPFDVIISIPEQRVPDIQL